MLEQEIKKLATQGKFLPEDEALFKFESPGPGLHTHDESNPFGIHRHVLGEAVDGGHTHTPQNPGGEHSHGEFAGMALIDGGHTHENASLGWHNHEQRDDSTIVPLQPENINT